MLVAFVVGHLETMNEVWFLCEKKISLWQSNQLHLFFLQLSYVIKITSRIAWCIFRSRFRSRQCILVFWYTQLESDFHLRGDFWCFSFRLGWTIHWVVKGELVAGLNQPTPPLERSRVVFPDRAQTRRQTANVVFFCLSFLQVHHVTPLVSFSGSYAFSSPINPQVLRLKAFCGNS